MNASYLREAKLTFVFSNCVSIAAAGQCFGLSQKVAYFQFFIIVTVSNL